MRIWSTFLIYALFFLIFCNTRYNICNIKNTVTLRDFNEVNVFIVLAHTTHVLFKPTRRIEYFNGICILLSRSIRAIPSISQRRIVTWL